MSIGPWAALLDEYQNTRLVGFPSRLSAAAGSPERKHWKHVNVLRDAAILTAGGGVGGRAWGLGVEGGGGGGRGFYTQHLEGLAEFLSYTFRKKKI